MGRHRVADHDIACGAGHPGLKSERPVRRWLEARSFPGATGHRIHRGVVRLRLQIHQLASGRVRGVADRGQPGRRLGRTGRGEQHRRVVAQGAPRLRARCPSHRLPDRFTAQRRGCSRGAQRLRPVRLVLCAVPGPHHRRSVDAVLGQVLHRREDRRAVRRYRRERADPTRSRSADHRRRSPPRTCQRVPAQSHHFDDRVDDPADPDRLHGYQRGAAGLPVQRRRPVACRICGPERGIRTHRRAGPDRVAQLVGRHRASQDHRDLRRVDGRQRGCVLPGHLVVARGRCPIGLRRRRERGLADLLRGRLGCRSRRRHLDGEWHHHHRHVHRRRYRSPVDGPADLHGRWLGGTGYIVCFFTMAGCALLGAVLQFFTAPQTPVTPAVADRVSLRD